MKKVFYTIIYFSAFVILIFIILNFLHIQVIPDYIFKNKKLEEYDTDRSFCYKNSNGINELYIFSGPIRFTSNDENLLNINNELIKYNKNGKTYYSNKQSNIQITIPEKINKNNTIQIKKIKSTKYNINTEFEFEYFFNNLNSTGKKHNIKNLAGDNVSSIQYIAKEENIECFSTNYGIINEIILNNKNEFILYLKSPCEVHIFNEDTVILGTENNIKALINKPLIFNIDKNNKIEFPLKVSIEKEGIYYKIKYKFKSKNKIKIILPIEARIEKSPDKSIYSNDLKYNNYLSWYNIYGNNEKKDCKIFVDFYDMFTPIAKEKIISVNYHVNIINKIDDINNIFLFKKIKSDWCSVNLNHNSIPIIGEVISKCKYQNNCLTFDITSLYKDYYDLSKDSQNNGGVIENIITPTEEVVLLSNDNSYKANYLVIKFKD